MRHHCAGADYSHCSTSFGYYYDPGSSQEQDYNVTFSSDNGSRDSSYNKDIECARKLLSLAAITDSTFSDTTAIASGVGDWRLDGVEAINVSRGTEDVNGSSPKWSDTSNFSYFSDKPQQLLKVRGASGVSYLSAMYGSSTFPGALHVGLILVHIGIL